MADSPRIITARKLGLTFANLFGQLGPEKFVTGHYSAGPRAADWRAGVERAKEFHRFHRDTRGWGGLAYHFMIADDGALICGRPTMLKGAHVGGHNTSNLGVNCPGTRTPNTDRHKPTERQRETYRWLLANAHTDALPKAHRTDLDLRGATLRGHNSWDGHTSNGCPGLFKPMYLAGLAKGPEEDLAEDDPALEDTRGDYPEPIDVDGVAADHRMVSEEEAAEAARAPRGAT